MCYYSKCEGVSTLVYFSPVRDDGEDTFYLTSFVLVLPRKTTHVLAHLSSSSGAESGCSG